MLIPPITEAKCLLYNHNRYREKITYNNECIEDGKNYPCTGDEQHDGGQMMSPAQAASATIQYTLLHNRFSVDIVQLSSGSNRFAILCTGTASAASVK